MCTFFGVLVIAVAATMLYYDHVHDHRFKNIFFEAQALKNVARATGYSTQSPFPAKKDFLDYMGQFFKHKKHEWIFVAFLRHGKVDRFSVNKGPDGTRVGPILTTGDIIRVCIKNGCECVLIGHNHPAGALAPSKQDRRYVEELMDSMALVGVRCEHWVFVAGRWRRYGLSLGQHLRRMMVGSHS